MPFLSFATTFHPEILKSTGLWFHLASSFPLFPCKMWMSNSFQASVNKGFGVMALPDCELQGVLVCCDFIA
ncbi:hypothetical protein Peur_063887 [Populus x canadensis]